MSDAPKTFDLERIVPELLSFEDPLEADTLRLHLDRYRFAGRFVVGRRVLDMACGVGYGSALLAEAGAARVVGVDLSEDAIAHARAHYARDGVEFVRADATAFAPGGPVDVIVSLETIEHLPDAEGFVRRIATLVAPGGVVVGSVPTTLSSDVNPYHLHDFSARRFRRLFAACGLAIVDEMKQAQPFSLLGVLRACGGSRRDWGLRKNLAGYYLRRPDMAARRLAAVLVHGFKNEYLVLAGRRP